jgi:DNA-binding response OmpR family regulator
LVEAEQGAGQLVLVVEDFEDAREMYAEFFRFSGYRVETAATGREALEKIQAHRPDIIVMDISLPQMSGTEITHSREALAAGVDEYCPKPASPEEVESRIRRLLQKKHF